MNTIDTVSSQDLKHWIDDKKDFVLLDVLPENSYQARHIPTALNVDFRASDFTAQVATHVHSKETPIVLYCMSQNCIISPAAAQRLSVAGYKNVTLHQGGLADWQDAGYAFAGSQAQEAVPKTCDSCGDCGCD